MRRLRRPPARLRSVATARLLVALASVFAAAQVGLAAGPRNVVLIIGDDHGWPDSGFMESPRTLQTNQGPLPLQEVVQTPNLDALAASGVLFRNGHTTASLCQPSLRTLLSAGGLHSSQWTALEAELEAVPGVGTIRFRQEVRYIRTVPRELRRLGCRSWEGGKMWEGTYEMAGFTDGLATSIGGLFTSVGDHFGRTDWDPASCGSTAASGASCPALEPLREFLDDVGDDCFFAWVAPMLPHLPNDAPPVYRAPYEALGLNDFTVGYLANVTWLDEIVGEVLAELDERGLRDDTLVLYVSDNGWGLDFQIYPGTGKGKATLYELGFRTPIILSGPGIPAGAVFDDLASTSDVPATILDYMGADEVPERQGMSLRPRIEGGAPLARTEIVAEQSGKGTFVRTASWRYLRFDDGHEELYRIDEDPFESLNVAAEHPDVVADLAARLDTWLATLHLPPEHVEISGELRDRDTGEPLAGGRLRLAEGSLGALAGDEGLFRIGPLPVGSHVLLADRPTTRLEGLGSSVAISLPATLLGRGLHVPVTGLTMRPTTGTFRGRLDGTLATQAGVPLAGETVKVAGRAGGRNVSLRALTDAQGRYRAENLPAGRYRISASVPRGYRRVTAGPVEIDSPGHLDVDLVAVPR